MKSLFRCCLFVFFIGTITAKSIYFDEDLDTRNDEYLTNLNDKSFLADKDFKVNERHVRHVELATESILQHFQKKFAKAFPKRTRKYDRKKNQTKPENHKHKRRSENKKKKDKKKKEKRSKGRKKEHKTTTTMADE